MFFWVKRKEVILDCFTYIPSVHEFSRPDFSYKFFPEWFLKLPKIVGEEGKKGPSLKGCKAFKDIYCKNTITIPSSFEVRIKVSPNKTFEWAMFGTTEESVHAVEHPIAQTSGMYDENTYQHLKIPTAWFFKTSRFINFVWLDHVWNRKEVLDYCVLPGVVDYKYQPDTLLNVIFKYKPEEYTITIPFAEPVAMLAPMENCVIKIKHHLEDFKYVRAINRPYFNPNINSTAEKYQFYKQIIKKANERNLMTKCPFGK